MPRKSAAMVDPDIGLVWSAGPWLDGVRSVEHYALRAPQIASAERCVSLGSPALVIRYGLGRERSVDQWSYCTTWLPASYAGPILLITPSRCIRIDLGIVTPTGSVWQTPEIAPVPAPPATVMAIRRATGSTPVIHLWDHSLSGGDDTERYLTGGQERSRQPVGVTRVEYPDVYDVLCMVHPGDVTGGTDDGLPTAAVG